MSQQKYNDINDILPFPTQKYDNNVQLHDTIHELTQFYHDRFNNNENHVKSTYIAWGRHAITALDQDHVEDFANVFKNYIHLG